ncbi:MAG: hypothetical protein N4A35_06420 [Flavobacteriales bacterium]|jgi:hypothetical protein|nr:hypothetical protein [Flavobacteriales bacterium]
MRYLFFLLIIGLISCSTTKTETTTAEKTVFFDLDYSVVNASFEEDIILLNNDNMKTVVQVLNERVEEKLLQKGYNFKEKSAAKQLLIIKQLTFKEFKIHVNGPPLNVTEIKVDYQVVQETNKSVYSETYSKESKEAFELSTIEELVHIVADSLVKKVIN